MNASRYIGRFAPSPTGPLHAGSLLAAAASYLRARQQQGQWLVRIEDIDPPREVPGAADDILRTLEHFGFEWDQPVMYQSTRMDAYRNALHQLTNAGHAYSCVCSRKMWQQALSDNDGPAGVYPGTCRPNMPLQRVKIDFSQTTNWRVNAGTGTTEFSDLLQGTQQVKWQFDQGDFVIWRKDQLPSYQLAVTIDDQYQGITEIVRGNDLLHETAGQQLLRRWLAFDQPQLMHIPVLLNSVGQKLSKQTGAAALEKSRAPQQLCTALRHLGMQPEAALSTATPQQIWTWAIAHWNPNLLNNINNLTQRPI